MKTLKVFILCLVMMIIFSGCSNTENNSVGIEESDAKLKEPAAVKEEARKKEITIAAAGDVMVHSPQFRSAYVGGEMGYDFRPVFEPVKKYIKSADIAVANLETTLAGKEKGFSGYPRFNSPEQIATALKETGFDILTTANNHSLDRGEYGVINTIRNIEEAGLSHAGTSRSEEDREQVLIKDVRGIKLAFLSYTYGTNGLPLPEGKPYLVNLIDRKEIKRDIERAREENAEVIIACMHFGVEYQREPGEAQKDLVDFLFDEGVDIVFGSHPHVLQPVELKEVETGNGEQKKTVVAYSLGNFVSNQRKKYRDSGVILQVNLEKDFSNGKTVIKEVNYVPTWVDRSYVDNKLVYKVLPVRDAIESYENNDSELISNEDYIRLKNVWKETTNHLNPKL